MVASSHSSAPYFTRTFIPTTTSAALPKRYQAVLRTSHSICSSTHSMMKSLDVENLSKEVVVSMSHERDGKENAVQYDLYRQGRIKKKRCVTTKRWDVLDVWSLHWNWWNRGRSNGLKGTCWRWKWVWWWFQWTVAVMVVWFHPAVGCPCFFLKNRDATRMRFWIIFWIFDPSCSLVSINVTAVVVRTKNIGLRIRRELRQRVKNAEK